MAEHENMNNISDQGERWAVQLPLCVKCLYNPATVNTTTDAAVTADVSKTTIITTVCQVDLNILYNITFMKILVKPF